MGARQWRTKVRLGIAQVLMIARSVAGGCFARLQIFLLMALLRAGIDRVGS